MTANEVSYTFRDVSHMVEKPLCIVTTDNNIIILQGNNVLNKEYTG